MQHPTSDAPRVSVIIPVLNEAQNLPHILPHIPKDVYEVILIDGHSEDDTIAVAQRVLPSIIVIQQENKGKGDALQCGFAYSSGDIIVMLDADGSTDPREIPRYVQALLTGADFSKGSRFMLGGGSDDITHLRQMGNWGLTQLVNLLFRTRFTDLCYGYNAFWRTSLERLNLTDCHGFEIETVLNLRALKAKLRMIEVPSHEYPRLHGVSKLHAWRDGWSVLRNIWREWRNQIATAPLPQPTATVPEEVVWLESLPKEPVKVIAE